MQENIAAHLLGSGFFIDQASTISKETEPAKQHTTDVSERIASQTMAEIQTIEPDQTQQIATVKQMTVEPTAQQDEIQSPPKYALTVVTPTRNERDNIRPLLQALKQALAGINTEIIFVDDSDDDTPQIIDEAEKSMGTPLFHIHLKHRLRGVDRTGGLATAVELGMKMAQAKYIAVIDADLQHPPAQLRVFYEEASKQDVDLVLASRYIKGGGYGGLDGVSRLLFSVGLKWTAKIVFPEQLIRVSDPLGGFFLLRRDLLTDITLRPIGYKILLEILLRSQWKSLIEVPYHFQARENGQSKASMKQGIMVLQHMGRLLAEVPAAGRLWKCTALITLNMLFTLTFFLFSAFIPAMWNTFILVVCALMACIDFVLINRFIFPPIRRSNREQTPDNAENTEQMELVKTAPEPVQVPQFREKLLARSALIIVVATICWISYTLPGAWILIAALFVGFSIITRKNIGKDQSITMLLGILVAISSIDYISWRFSVVNWTGWWIALPLLAAETLGSIHTVGFQYTLWPRAKPKLHISEDPTQFPIFIFIPTVNEGVAILEPTVRGAIAARDKYLAQFPHGQVEIVICNDGMVANAPNWKEAVILAKKSGIHCITRQIGGGAKAGNIEHARQQLGVTGNMLMVIFDADQIARPDFLLKTVPAFGDKRLGWVQTGQYYSNLDNPVARWSEDQQSMFYNLLCPGKAALNTAFICGTNVVIRAAALDQIGGFPQDSVTEDFSASIALHPYWQSIFLTDVLATGLGPMDVPSYLKQQRRWAIGTLGVLRTHWRQIFLPARNGLNIEQRVQYFLACTHYLCGIRDLIYLISPILFIMTSIPAVRGSTLPIFLWHFLPYWLASMAALWYAGNGITGLRGIIIGFGCFPVLIESLLSVILQRKVGFAVTSKQRGNGRSWNYLLIYLLFILAGLACIIWTMRAPIQQQASVFISAMWILYSLSMLGGFLLLNFKDMRFQQAAKNAGQLDATESGVYTSRLPNRETGLRPLWNLGLALLLASVILTGLNLHIDGAQPTPFVVKPLQTNQTQLGVSLPVQLLQNRPSELERKLNGHFSIVGRTQDVHDQFDRTWADQLFAHQTQPWITLEFGTFGPYGRPPADASLSAIANGVHDDDIKRWAQSIRNYNHPVYLTTLLHVDRNWSLSSAVANGGIPQDTPRAWSHIQSIFKATGTKNVAWVWAPADPAHDQVYAPPATTIDVVLLSMISYPNAQWTDPNLALQNVAERYPNKPIIVEVSAAGDQEQKASWLTKVGDSVVDKPNVYALIYHEGAPGTNPSHSENNRWSMLSDKDSTNAMQHIVTDLTKKKSLQTSNMQQHKK